jgi:hypothetical protein
LIPWTQVISRRFKLAAVSGGIVGAAVVAGFGPAVRYEAEHAAERYGAEIAVERVSPTISGVRLQGVDVTLAEVPSAKVHLDEVVVAYGAGGRSVALRGGVVSAIGAREVVLRQAEAWRAHHLAAGGAAQAGSTSGNTTELAGLRVRWQDAAATPTETFSATDLRFARADGRVTVSAAETAASFGHTTVSVKNGRVELSRTEAGGSYRLAGLSADSVDAELTVPVGKADAASALEDLGSLRPPKHAPTEPARAPVAPGPDARVPVAPASVGRARVAPAPVSPSSAVPSSPAAPGASLRSALVGAARALDLALDPSAKVHLAGVHARIHRGGDVLNLGPGALDVARTDGRLVVELAPELRAPGKSPPDRVPSTAAAPRLPPAPSTAAATPGALPAPSGAAAAPGTAPAEEQALTFRLAVPLGEAAQEIVADVQGGPIWLSSLGVREGDFGLFDVGLTSLSTRSHLVLSADGRTLRVDGAGQLHALSLRSAALSDEPVAGLELAFGLKGELDLDGSRARIAQAELDLGAIHVVLKGDYDRVRAASAAVEDAYRFRGTFDLPLTACQSMLDATPKGLVPKLSGMRMAGSFAVRGRADVDTARLDTGFHLDWDATNSCRIVEAPRAVSVERFRAPFRHIAYDAQGRAVEVETGPGTADWVPFRGISKFMEVAVLTTEDAGFEHHHGFDHEAIKNSIRENLRKKKFVRGASTLSMQLAKNLYLDRGKNLSRKLQEAVLTMYLEQELTKEQILELYFNVVEFGPMLYGIGPAAHAYFSTSPNDLSLGQSLYISSILPNPKVQHFGSGGAVAAGWMSYLQKLMKTARNRSHITDEELEEGLRETVVRGSPSPQRGPRGVNGPIDPTAPEIPADAPSQDEWP